MPYSRFRHSNCVRVFTVTSCKVCRCSRTRIWPIDVAENTSLQAEVDGFDLSNKFFPPRAWLPSNIRLHLQDVYKPFPEAFSGLFDVVHLRLFLTLSADQVMQILQKAMTLLSTFFRDTSGSSNRQLISPEPGGYIQWTEHDKTAITPIAADSSQSTTTTAAQAFIDLEQHPFPGYNARCGSPFLSNVSKPSLNASPAGLSISPPPWLPPASRWWQRIACR